MIILIGDSGIGSLARHIIHYLRAHGFHPVLSSEVPDATPVPNFDSFRKILHNAFGGINPPDISREKFLIEEKKSRGGKSFHQVNSNSFFKKENYSERKSKIDYKRFNRKSPRFRF